MPNHNEPENDQLDHQPIWAVLGDIVRERERQFEKWGEQNHPDGTGPDGRLVMDDVYLRRHGVAWSDLAEWAKARTARAADAGVVTYEHILTEEWAEAMAESDPERLRTELVQVAAVAVQWIELLDRRPSRPGTLDGGDAR